MESIEMGRFRSWARAIVLDGISAGRYNGDAVMILT